MILLSDSLRCRYCGWLKAPPERAAQSSWSTCRNNSLTSSSRLVNRCTRAYCCHTAYLLHMLDSQTRASCPDNPTKKASTGPCAPSILPPSRHEQCPRWDPPTHLFEGHVQVATLLCHQGHHATHGQGINRLRVGVVHIVCLAGPAHTVCQQCREVQRRFHGCVPSTSMLLPGCTLAVVNRLYPCCCHQALSPAHPTATFETDSLRCPEQRLPRLTSNL